MAHTSLTDLSPSDRTNVVNLILQYLNDAIVLEHANLDINGPEHRGDGDFFQWHEAYIQPLDSYISSQSNGQFDGLPYFDITQPIPDEFFGVYKNRDDGSPWTEPDGTLVSTDMNRGPFFDRTQLSPYMGSAICAFASFADMGTQFYGDIHSTFHNDVGGGMETLFSPSRCIFWPWHKWVELVYLNWQSCNK